MMPISWVCFIPGEILGLLYSWWNLEQCVWILVYVSVIYRSCVPTKDTTSTTTVCWAFLRYYFDKICALHCNMSRNVFTSAKLLKNLYNVHAKDSDRKTFKFPWLLEVVAEVASYVGSPVHISAHVRTVHHIHICG